MTSNPPLPLGYSPLRPGQIANVVTCLEMLEAPARRPIVEFPAPYRLQDFGDDLTAYRSLFRRIGEDWLWHSRLTMPDDGLSAILQHPLVEVRVLRDGASDVGLLELDFRTAGQCELAFFGLTPEVIGGGLGRALMNTATALAWDKPIQRFWVHTCTFDHPGALAFYIRSGFRPYAYQVEVQADPRLTGHLPRTAAPHIPLIET